MPAIKNALLRYRIIDRSIRNEYNPYPTKEQLRQACEEEIYGTSVKRKDKWLVLFFYLLVQGLAQVKGLRGETKSSLAMEHRIRLDTLYIENWSLILDIKIIVLTIINVFKGDEKAY